MLLAFQIVVSSCAATKSREDQSALGKLWHNMNSHYNGYFNARELMETSLLSLEEGYADNYTRRLEMFPFLATEDISGVKEDMDIAIEKVAVVAKKHPYSNWVDDCYLLVGQAQLIQQDYESAERTLRFLTTEFRPRPQRKKTKARKKGRSAAAEESPEEAETFRSRREVELSPEQERKQRLRARKEAEKERDRIRKEREKERKQLKKEREKERKARARARKKGVKFTPSVRRDTAAIAGLEDEPTPVEAAEETGPIGMISIFNEAANSSGAGQQYGKKSGSYLVKHRPAYQEGRLWLAWTLVKRDNYDRAQLILDDLRADRGTFPDVRRRAMAVQAFLYLEQERLPEAIPFLEEAAEVARTRTERARYYFIAGQLNQELGQPAAAARNFTEAIAAAPDYDLELGARLNLAQNDFLSGTGTAATALKKLQRMVREEKNIPYASRIYFSMAAIALKEGDTAQGKTFLQQAVSDPSAGPVQQLEAYKLLGDLAYADQAYLPAKLYYDSTLMAMGQNDERYAATLQRRDRLTGVADLTADIATKDSLLRIGMMPEAERTQWAEALFEQQRQASVAPVVPAPSGGRANPAIASSGGSSFWAYDAASLRKGQRDFARRWGDRALADNWRRSTAAREDIFSDPDDTRSANEESVLLATQDEINTLLEGIPTTEAEQKTLRLKQAENWFNLGREYRDVIEDLPQAVTALEKLEQLYPGSAREAESWYYLYLIHQQMGHTAKADEYAVKLRKYKGSRFARLANEPGYAAKLLSEDNELTRTYEAAYAAFEQGAYEKAHQMATKGRATLLGQHPLKSRYALLLAMTTGNLQGKPAYVAALRQVVAQFADTPEEVRAREILRLLGEDGARLPGRAINTSDGSFRESMKELHYVLVVFENREINIGEAKVNVSEFNNKYHKLDRIRITNVYLGQQDDSKPVLVLRRYKTGEEANKYVLNAKERNEEFMAESKFDYTLLAVSQSNYREILKARSVSEYIPWFKENYPQ